MAQRKKWDPKGMTAASEAITRKWAATKHQEFSMYHRQH